MQGAVKQASKGEGYTITGVYGSRRTLDSAVQLLVLDRFSPKAITTVGPTHDGIRVMVGYSNDTKAPEWSAFGGCLGLLLGGLIGYLEPQLLEAILNAGESPPLDITLSTLSGAGTGALLGMITGGAFGVVLPEHTVHVSNIPRGSGPFLLSVNCADSEWCDKANDILEQTGAKQISTVPSQHGYHKDSLAHPDHRSAPHSEL